MKSLVDQFVLMAKPSTKEKKACHLTELIQGIIYLLENQANKANVKIEFPITKDVTCQVDESQIKQVLMNLIQNAIEATPPNGLIKISLSETIIEATEFVRIQVEDTGEGMTSSQIANVFTPFFTTKENGLGLGLAICKQIIEGHRGMLDVTSRKDDGTTFSILLPK